MRSLYKKRGFTLVELIVVIAIIGVLAAILVPTLMGMVTKARVTSLNSTAANIQRNMNVMLLQSDPLYYGIISGQTMTLKITVKRQNGKAVWNCSAAQPGTYTENNLGHYTWGSGGTYTEDQTGDITTGEGIICASLSDKTGITNGSMVLVLRGGSCNFVVYTNETNEIIPESEYPAAVDGKAPITFVWDGKTDGVSPTGMLIGTAPAVSLEI